MADDYLYDVAFSFHSADEGLAHQLNDVLQDQFKTFIYTERQDRLAGSNGVATFTQLFQKEARVVVVLYRNEWGKTPFTRIEETAIRNRAFDEGYDFTLFVFTSDDAVKPLWLPKPQIYLNLGRFGLQGVAAAVSVKVGERGGETRSETFEDRAERINRQMQLDEKRQMFLQGDGAIAARAATEELVDQLKQRVEKLKLQPSLDGIGLVTQAGHTTIYSHITALSFCWHDMYVNSIRNAELKVEIYDGVPRLPGFKPFFKDPRIIGRRAYRYDLISDDLHAFVEFNRTGGFYSPSALADELAKVFLEATAKEAAKQLRR